jgi:hypothetical protein
VHALNYSYGDNLKNLLHKSAQGGADFVVMLHPGHQYHPILLPNEM